MKLRVATIDEIEVGCEVLHWPHYSGNPPRCIVVGHIPLRTSDKSNDTIYALKTEYDSKIILAQSNQLYVDKPR